MTKHTSRTVRVLWDPACLKQSEQALMALKGRMSLYVDADNLVELARKGKILCPEKALSLGSDKDQEVFLGVGVRGGGGDKMRLARRLASECRIALHKGAKGEVILALDGKPWLSVVCGDADFEHLSTEVTAMLGLGVSSPAFLSKFRNLKMLNLWLGRPPNGNIDVSALALLTGLTDLSLYCSSLTDVSPLSKLTNLVRLKLLVSDDLDFSPLAGLTKLTHLDMTAPDSTPSDLRFLSKMTRMEDLRIYGAKNLTDIRPLSRMTRLKYVAFSICDRLTDLRPLRGLPSLVGVYMPFAPCKDLSPLEKCRAIEWLNVGRVTDEVRTLACSAILRRDRECVRNSIEGWIATCADFPGGRVAALEAVAAALTLGGKEPWVIDGCRKIEETLRGVRGAGKALAAVQRTLTKAGSLPSAPKKGKPRAR